MYLYCKQQPPRAEENPAAICLIVAFTWVGQQPQCLPPSWKTGLSLWYRQEPTSLSATLKSFWHPRFTQLKGNTQHRRRTTRWVEPRETYTAGMARARGREAFRGREKQCLRASRRRKNASPVRNPTMAYRPRRAKTTGTAHICRARLAELRAPCGHRRTQTEFNTHRLHT